MVSEYIDAAVETLALIHSGGVPFACDDCDRETQFERRCCFLPEFVKGEFEAAAESVFYSTTTDAEYFNCPISQIPPFVYDLFDLYSFYKEFETPLTPRETPSFLWQFAKKYNAAKNGFLKEKAAKNARGVSLPNL
jgi:hypothetical protein